MQNGTDEEKRKVFAAVKKKYPELARRSGVISTASNDNRKKIAALRARSKSRS